MQAFVTFNVEDTSVRNAATKVDRMVNRFIEYVEDADKKSNGYITRVEVLAPTLTTVWSERLETRHNYAVSVMVNSYTLRRDTVLERARTIQDTQGVPLES